MLSSALSAAESRAGGRETPTAAASSRGGRLRSAPRVGSPGPGPGPHQALPVGGELAQQPRELEALREVHGGGSGPGPGQGDEGRGKGSGLIQTRRPQPRG